MPFRGHAADRSSTVKGPSELKLSITISPDKTVSDLKDAIAAQSDVEKARQRLIYSGTYRVEMQPAVATGSRSCAESWSNLTHVLQERF